MGIFSFIKRKTPPPIQEQEQPAPKAETIVDPSPMTGYGGYNRVWSLTFDGEKDLGSMGVIKRYVVDHAALRLRGHQLYLESDVCQALFNRSAVWGIGSGLKLQASPQKRILEADGIDIEVEDFNEDIEALFSTWAGNQMCDYQNQRGLAEIANEAWVNCDVGGDVLIIMRLVDGMPKVQIVDGMHLQTPMMWGTSINMDVVNPATKNRVRHGVEIDGKGNHVAYWIYTGTDQGVITSYERVEANMNVYPYSQMARLIYGLKYRIDNVRGIPLITAVMETAAKMARYREAMIAGAESRAKVAFSVEHTKDSTGESPFQAQLSQASGFANPSLPTDSLGEALANKVAATSENQAYNLPIGSKLMMHESKQENGFTDFYTINFDIVCAVAGYPPEVIMSKYNSNYSASRAAIKDFEHTLKVKRAKFSKQFYQFVYNFCLDVWTLQGTIQAQGYMNALATRNQLVLAAYRNARWAGDAVPHIDPYKEVQAIRAMLPEDSANMPLITMEQAVEILDNGDFNDVIEQWEKEQENAKDHGIEKTVPKTPIQPQPNGNPAKRKESDD